MVEHHAGNPPRTHLRGLVSTYEHLLLLVLPANRPAPWRWTSSLGRPGCERGAAAGAPAKRQPRSAVDPRASHAQARWGTTATRRTQSAKRGLSRGTDVRDPARSGQRGRRGRGHRTPVCPDACLSGHSDHTARVDTGRLDTGRPRDQVDGGPHGGQSDVRRGRRPGILDGHDDGGAGWAAQTSLGLQRLRRSATDDGSAVTTHADALPGQLRSTACMKLRLGALLSSDDYGSRVERTAKLHPLCEAL
jgi:hypothetical protein